MPKETISPPGSDFDVHVGWSEGSVQLATTTKDVAKAAAVATDILERAAASPHELTTGYYADLDEPSLTALIGHLQRARRKAFGLDASVDAETITRTDAVANAARLLVQAETIKHDDWRRSTIHLADYWMRLAGLLGAVTA